MKMNLTLLLLWISYYATAQNGWKEMELKGKVKSLQTQETYRYKKNGVAFTPWEKTYAKSYTFDKTGWYTEFAEKKSDGTSGYKIKYTNNTKEKNIVQAYFDKDDKPTYSKTVRFDDKGRTLEITDYSKDGQAGFSYAYTYDDKGNNTGMTGKKADGTISSKYNWIFNDKNQKTALTLETPGYANSYMSWKYDEKGNIAEETWYNGKKEITFRFERVYDDKGNKIEERKYKNGTTLLDKTAWKYEYDSKGNWMKRTQLTQDGEEFSIMERTIIYY